MLEQDEQRDELLEKIEDLISRKRYAELRDLLLPLEAQDIAGLFMELDDKVPMVFRLLPKEQAAEVFVELDSEEQEMLIVMLLDGRNHLLGEQTISKGTVGATLITPREVFVEALKFHAVSLILVHNHPSGDPSPSECDVEITERIYRSGELIGVKLLDHIVIGDQKYVSFREQGMLPV